MASRAEKLRKYVDVITGSHAVHRMRETSLEAYDTHPNLSEMKAAVYQALLELNMMGEYPTDRELARDMGFGDPNKVRPRRHELAEADLVEEAGKRECSITGRRALTWKVKRG